MDNWFDLAIRIGKAVGGGYEVTADAASLGRAGPEPIAPSELAAADLCAWLACLRDEPEALDAAAQRSLGERIFALLFRGQVLRLFTGLFDHRIQGDRDAHLRLQIEVGEDAPELADLPWELAWWRDLPLAVQERLPLVRRWLNLDFGPLAPLAIRGQPRVLIVIPRGSGLDTDRERNLITEVLRRSELPFDVLDGSVSVQRLDDALAGQTYHILHFIGHGAAVAGAGGALRSMLRFNAAASAGEHADEEWIGHDRIQALLSGQRDLRLVVLNACQGAQVGGRAASQPGQGFIGLAPALLRAGVPAVLAMQHPIRDDIAVLFGETFYKRLTAGRGAGCIDLAVAQARNACYLNFPGDLGFVTPVLFLRAGDSRLFGTDLPEERSAAPDPGALAGEIVRRLVQHLTETGSVVERRSGGALLRSLQAALTPRPVAHQALADLAAAPDDTDVQAGLRLQLRKLLAADAVLAREVERLLKPGEEAALRGGETAEVHDRSSDRLSDRSIRAGRDVKITGTVITGDIGGNVTIGGRSRDR